jgi:NAD(P)-dependent dehydrogenase (short-subunit alcohol dehydrogenase family)
LNRALIVGSSGGIGSAIGSALAARGTQVTGLSRTYDGLDVTDPISVDRNLEAVQGPFDLLLIASGILASPGADPEKSLDQIDASRMAEVMAVNAIGPALILRHAPRLLPPDSPSVVAVLTARVGSIADNHLGGWYAYRASKAAANQVVKTAAIEIGRKRKHAVVVALHPGTVETPFTEAYTTHAKVPPDEAAQNLVQVIDRLTPSDTGGFFDWRGNTVPW